MIVNGKRAIHLKTAIGNASAEQRANLIAARLTAALEKGAKPQTVAYTKVGRRVSIMVGNSLHVKVTKQEAMLIT